MHASVSVHASDGISTCTVSGDEQRTGDPDGAGAASVVSDKLLQHAPLNRSTLTSYL